tara:strand:+ start:254 stop:427 length:174 start_codon:yes stop_codon:yes gene_type:complete
MKINGWSFHKYCIELSGLEFKDRHNKPIYKYQLYYKGVCPYRLLNRETKYKFKNKAR